jgi:hypothetical protein
MRMKEWWGCLLWCFGCYGIVETIVFGMVRKKWDEMSGLRHWCYDDVLPYHLMNVTNHVFLNIIHDVLVYYWTYV